MDNDLAISALQNKIGDEKTNEIMTALMSSRFAINEFLNKNMDLVDVLIFLKRNVNKCEELIKAKDAKSEPTLETNVWEIHG